MTIRALLACLLPSALLAACAGAPVVTPDEIAAQGPTARVRVVSLDAAESGKLFGPNHSMRVSIFDNELCEGERSLASVQAKALARRNTQDLGMPGNSYSKQSASEILLPAGEDIFLIFAGFHSVATKGAQHVTDVGYCSVPVSAELSPGLDYEMAYARGRRAGRCSVSLSTLDANGQKTEQRTVENAVTPFSRQCRELLAKRPGLAGRVADDRHPLDRLISPSGKRP